MKVSTKTEKLLLTGLLTLATATLAFASYASLSLFMAAQEQNANYPGQVALRSYFQKGSGTEEDPFVISRPQHFYNLTRLQNLGLFGTKTYFSLGYDPNNPSDPYGTTNVYDAITNPTGTQLKFYPNNSSTTTTDMVSYLDMSSQDTVLSVGNEGAPFYGVFEGNGKEVRGLHVKSNPEDVGVFGYTYSGSKVVHTFFNNLTVEDDGYTSSSSNLWDSTKVTAFGSLQYKVADGDYTDVANYLPPESLSFGAYRDLTFKANIPTNSGLTDGSVTYEARSSSEYVYADVTGTDSVTFKAHVPTSDTDTSANCIANNESFSSTNLGALSVRISIIVSELVNGYRYSRVLSTYLITFVNHIATDNTKSITAYAQIDGVDSTQSYYTQYAHGNNIGFLIGHCDGTCKGCYVQSGQILLNEGNDAYTKVTQETDTGLIGEIGSALSSDFAPQKQYDVSGDAGVVNFTSMYDEVVDKNVKNTDGTTTTTYATFSGTASPYSYTPIGLKASNYTDYLRWDYLDNTPKNYATNLKNSMDFAGLHVIKDTDSSLYFSSTQEYTIDGGTTWTAGADARVTFAEDTSVSYRTKATASSEAGTTTTVTAASVNRNLGVFSLVSGDYDNTSNSTYTNDIGSFAATRMSTSSSDWFSDFYYTTAEWKNDSSLSRVLVNDYTSNSNNNWNFGWDKGQHIYSGVRLPSYADEETWNPELEEKVNFVFHCAFSSTAASNYFFNTDSEFLRQYFKYKLIDKNGASIVPNTPDFGIFVKDVDTREHKTSNITVLNTYLALQNTAATIPVASIEDGVYPVRTIQFSVDNDNGANVTVLASSDSTGGGFVGIYDKAKAAQFTDSTLTSYLNRPSYAMFIPYNGYQGNTRDDSLAYFDYSYSDNSATSRTAGQTDTVASFASLSNYLSTKTRMGKLFAHTFKLPKGDYFITSPAKSANIFYVCAQGQNNSGNYGNQTNVYSAANTITNTDFSTNNPIVFNSALADDKYEYNDNYLTHVNFEAKFLATPGTLSVSASTDGTNKTVALTLPDSELSTLSSALIFNEKNNYVTYNGTSYKTRFIKLP